MILHFKTKFVEDLNALRQEVSSYAIESNLWKNLPGTSNSAGHLTLHLIGNLNHFVGAGLGKTGYIRRRDEEFSGSSISKQELLKIIDDCTTTVELSFNSISEEDMAKNFPLPWREGLFYNTHFMLVQLTAHFSYHLGQINYHRRYFNA